jgi:hypothetical protein
MRFKYAAEGRAGVRWDAKEGRTESSAKTDIGALEIVVEQGGREGREGSPQGRARNEVGGGATRRKKERVGMEMAREERDREKGGMGKEEWCDVRAGRESDARQGRGLGRNCTCYARRDGRGG